MPETLEKLIPETLAGKLKRLRKERGISLAALAARTGLSRSYLSQLENGVQANPSKDKLAALATFYQLNTNEFVFEVPPTLAGVSYEEFDDMARRLTPEQRNEVYPIIRRYASSNPRVL
jgi:transcriptional regulator with XRE-family HTH domain